MADVLGVMIGSPSGTGADPRLSGSTQSESCRSTCRARRATSALALGLLVLGLGASCGPESYVRGEPADAAREVPADSPGTGGTAGSAGGGGSAGAGMDDGGADVCSVPGGVTGDAGIPTFSMSWTFDAPGGLSRWSPIGQPAPVVAATTAVLDTQDGYPDPGSVHMSIPFSADGQQVALGFSFSPAQNFAGKILSARVRLNSCNPSGTIMVGLAFKSVANAYVFASSAVPTIVAANGWTTLSLSFDAPDGFVDLSHHDADGGVIHPDPTAVLEIDVLVLTGSPPFTTADVSIDTIGISDARDGG